MLGNFKHYIVCVSISDYQCSMLYMEVFLFFDLSFHSSFPLCSYVILRVRFYVNLGGFVVIFIHFLCYVLRNKYCEFVSCLALAE